MVVAGPIVTRYADQIGATTQEVVEWMNEYITGPWPEAQLPHLEPTEKEREASIKRYVAGQVDRRGRNGATD